MAIKKGLLDNYFNEVSSVKRKPVNSDSKFTHNRVFDTPSLPSSEKTAQPELVNNKETISKQLVNNWETIREPDSKPLVNNEETISKQTVNNWETNSKQISKQDWGTNSKPLVNKLVNKEVTTPTIIQEIKRLFGLQKILFFYIIEDCKYQGGLLSSPITSEMLCKLLNSKATVVKTTTQRLKNKGLIKRQSGKTGKGGFTIFSITEEVKNAAIEELAFSKQLVNELVNTNSKQLVNNWETPISSSIYI